MGPSDFGRWLCCALWLCL